ncbi:MAG: CDP-alcohol phosphatidyltransferase family protein [Planctomycetota bacterium]
MNGRQIPNLITLSRLLLAGVAFWFFERMLHQGGTPEHAQAAAWAFWLYAVAASTDVLDGFLARRYHWVTALGRVADPVVDKLLTLGALVYLAADSSNLALPGDSGPVMPVWAVVLVLAREFLVTTLRGLVENRGLAFPADRFGKAKMALQTAYVLILVGAAGGIAAALGLPFLTWLRTPPVIAVLFWSMIAMTVFSGANYSLRAARMLAGESK